MYARINNAETLEELFNAMDSTLDDIGCEVPWDAELDAVEIWYTEVYPEPRALEIIEATTKRAIELYAQTPKA